MRIVEELVEIWPNEVCDTGVLGSTAVSTASQATRLGKGSSVTVMGIKGN